MFAGHKKLGLRGKRRKAYDSVARFFRVAAERTAGLHFSSSRSSCSFMSLDISRSRARSAWPWRRSPSASGPRSSGGRTRRHALEDFVDPARRLCEIPGRCGRRKHARPRTSGATASRKNAADAFPLKPLYQRAASRRRRTCRKFHSGDRDFRRDVHALRPSYNEPGVDGVQPGSPAAIAGIQQRRCHPHRQWQAPFAISARSKQVVTLNTGETLRLALSGQDNLLTVHAAPQDHRDERSIRRRETHDGARHRQRHQGEQNAVMSAMGRLMRWVLPARRPG